MKFTLIDRIIELAPRERIVAVKAVSRAEEYLDDHFPTFPVLPGVLMLETLAEAAGWLVRQATDFRHSIVLLQEARNVTYKSFVKPGHLLQVEVVCKRIEENRSEFSGIGLREDTEVVRARFSLVHYCLADKHAPLAPTDEEIINNARQTYEIIRPT